MKADLISIISSKLFSMLSWNKIAASTTSERQNFGRSPDSLESLSDPEIPYSIRWHKLIKKYVALRNENKRLMELVRLGSDVQYLRITHEAQPTEQTRVMVAIMSKLLTSAYCDYLEEKEAQALSTRLLQH